METTEASKVASAPSDAKPSAEPDAVDQHPPANDAPHASDAQVNGASDPTPQANGGRDDPEHGHAAGLSEKKSELKEKKSELKDKISDKKDKIKTKAKPPGGFDPTPFPDAPPGYTVKFVFHGASNLPMADIGTHAADPYLHATLKAAVPQRHEEDPVLTHRTRTLRKTLEPDWNEEWIVANVPASGFTLKCRLYDEDWPDHDDRLGNVTITIPSIDEKWEGFGSEGKIFEVKKHMGSKRAYFLKGIASALSKDIKMTPLLRIGIDVLEKSKPPHAQMYTVGPTRWIKHYSPMIGRLTGIKVNKNEEADATSSSHPDDKKIQKYDFQANELQLAGPVPEKLYHRYVEFRPVIGMMFSSHGLRGRILNKALHKQHRRIYNYDSTTEHGWFERCSNEASLQFLKMVHFDEGGRIFTYVVTLDGLMCFTETGREFGIDLLSKHTMHSDVATYIACSGEFFVRRLAHPDSSTDPKPDEPTHPSDELPGGPPNAEPPRDPRHYQLVIDNDSGTYRPDKSVLPELQKFLQKNFPGLGIVAMHWEDEELKKMKEAQRDVKKKEGKGIHMVLNRSPSNSSFSSDDESRLGDLERDDGEDLSVRVKSKKEKALEVLQDPSKFKDAIGMRPSSKAGEGKAHTPEASGSAEAAPEERQS